MRARWVAVLVVAVLVACGREEPPAKPVTPSISIDPADLSSNLGSEPLQVFVDRAGSAALVDEVSRSILLTGPGGEPVELDRSSSMETDGRDATITVRPKAPLAAGWHVLSLPAPADVSVLVPALGERHGIRFNPASAPTLAAFYACVSSGARWAGLAFSEPVELATVREKLKLALEGVECAIDSTPAREVRFVSFDCGAGAELPRSAWVEVRPGITSTTGLPLALLDGRHDFRLDLLREAARETGRPCLEWRLQ